MTSSLRFRADKRDIYLLTVTPAVVHTLTLNTLGCGQNAAYVAAFTRSSGVLQLSGSQYAMTKSYTFTPTSSEELIEVSLQSGSCDYSFTLTP